MTPAGSAFEQMKYVSYLFSCFALLWFRDSPARRQVHGDTYQSDKGPCKLGVYLKFFSSVAIVEIQLSARSSDGDNME